MSKSWPKAPDKAPRDAATQLQQLRAWLQITLDLLASKRRQAGQHRGLPEYPALLQAFNEQEIILQEVLDKMEALEHGSEGPNRKTDFLGADQLPPVHLTDELAEQ